MVDAPDRSAVVVLRVALGPTSITAGRPERYSLTSGSTMRVM